MSGSTWGSDWLAFLDPDTSIMDGSKSVTYYSEAEAIVDGGTAEDAEWENYDEECKDDVEYPFGTAVLCSFLSTDVTFTYAGQVNQDAEYSTIDLNKPYPFVCNIYPGDLTFGQIKMEGSTWGSDWVVFLDPETSVMDGSRSITYYSEAEAIVDGGTAEDAEWENYDEECKDDVPLRRGEGFLCSFLSPNVKIIFPTFKAE